MSKTKTKTEYLVDYKDDSLVRKAKAIAGKPQKNRHLSQAEIDLCYAWAAREVSNRQFNTVMGKKSNYNPAYLLAQAVRQEIIG